MREREIQANDALPFFTADKEYIQNIAEVFIGRKLSSDEFDEVKDLFTESVDEHTYHCIDAALSNLEWMKKRFGS